MLRSVRGRLSRLTPANFGQSLAAARGFRSTVPVSPRRGAARAQSGVARRNGHWIRWQNREGFGRVSTRRRGGWSTARGRGLADAAARAARLGSARSASERARRPDPHCAGSRAITGYGSRGWTVRKSGSDRAVHRCPPEPNRTPPPRPQALAAVPYDKLTIGVPKETFPLERRVAQSPESVKKVGGSEARGGEHRHRSRRRRRCRRRRRRRRRPPWPHPTGACVTTPPPAPLHRISSPMRASTSRSRAARAPPRPSATTCTRRRAPKSRTRLARGAPTSCCTSDRRPARRPSSLATACFAGAVRPAVRPRPSFWLGGWGCSARATPRGGASRNKWMGGEGARGLHVVCGMYRAMGQPQPSGCGALQCWSNWDGPDLRSRLRWGHSSRKTLDPPSPPTPRPCLPITFPGRPPYPRPAPAPAPTLPV